MNENVMKTKLMIIHKIMKVNTDCCGRNMSTYFSAKGRTPIVGRYIVSYSVNRLCPFARC